MITIKNTAQDAKNLLDAILKSGVTPVFDIDGIALDARQRQKIYTRMDFLREICTEDQIGQLDLEHYRANTTADLVQQDRDLPLLEVMRELNKRDIKYHVATARVVTACPHSRKLFKDRGILPDVLICRSGDHDKRRDSDLKASQLVAKFSQRQRENMVLIDDSLGNCRAVMQVGLKAIHVPFDGC